MSSHPLRQYFPDYDGDKGVDPAVNFIKQKFRDIAKVHVRSVWQPIGYAACFGPSGLCLVPLSISESII